MALFGSGGHADGFPAAEPGAEASAFIGVYRRLDFLFGANSTKENGTADERR
jgi:hypothetical protein